MAKSVNPEASEVAFFFHPGEGRLSKCLCGEAPPRGPTPYHFFFFFNEKVTLSQTLFRTLHPF